MTPKHNGQGLAGLQPYLLEMSPRMKPYAEGPGYGGIGNRPNAYAASSSGPVRFARPTVLIGFAPKYRSPANG